MLKNSIRLIILVSCISVQAQDFAALPKLVPSYSEDFSDYHSFPSICFEEVFFDARGKMWLLPCSTVRTIDAIHLFQFDGYDFSFVGGDWELLTKRSRFGGLYKNKAFVGMILGDRQRQFFYFDLQEEKLQLIDIEPGGLLEFLTVTENDRIFLVTEKTNTLHFYEWTEEELLPQGQFLLPDSLRRRINQLECIFLNEEEFWFKKLDKNFILRINKKSGKVQQISAADFPGTRNGSDTTLEVGPVTGLNVVLDNGFYFYRLIEGIKVLYRFDFSTERLELVRDFPPKWGIERIVADQVGNKVYLFKDEIGNYQSVLQTSDGKRFDYTALFEPINGIPVFHYQSSDFREKVIISHNRGVLLQQVKTEGAIQFFLPGVSIRDMVECMENQVLVGTQSKGLFLLDLQDATTSPFNVPGCPSDMGSFKFGLQTDDHNRLWYKMGDDIVRYDPVDRSCTTWSTGIQSIYAFSLISSNELAVIGRDGRLFRYNLETLELKPLIGEEKESRIQGRLQDVYYDHKNGLWIATNDGLNKVDIIDGTIETFGKEPPFKDFRMTCIEPDDQGRLWLGTSLRGVQIFDPKTREIVVINNKQGLANNVVVSILEDEDGDRWLGTYNGLSIVSSDGNVLANLTEKSGLREKENNRFSNLRTKNGKLLIGTINGVHVIDPQSVKRRLGQPENLKVYLTSIEYYDPQEKADVYHDRRLNNLNAIQLAASKRYVNLQFALSNYFKPEENQYAYMLSGLDKGWIDLGNHRSLNLTNLPVGHYQLLIKGADPNGNWSQEPLRIAIHAKEFFYKKTWFYLLVLFSLLALVSGIAWLWIQRLRIEVKKATHQIRKDKETIEQQALRLMDIDKAKSIFFTNISHEFRTPLTVISGMASKLSKVPKERLEHSYNMIRRNSDNLLNLVNQILDLRKLESGKLEVDLVKGDVIPYLRYIFESFESLAQNKDIRAHLLVDAKEVIMDHDKKKLLRIVSNLLSNAIKFTPEGGNIYFILNTLGDLKSPRVLSIKVKDTGIGIPKKKLPHIFDRFYQVDGSSTRVGEGTGIGLALCKELVTLLGGEIKVDTEEGVGTTFTVSLPITQNANPVSKAMADQQLETETGLAGISQTIKPTPLEMVNPGSDLPLLLLIEDNSDVIQYLITCLENQYRLITAQDGEEGIEKALESIPDGIISDVMMPKKDGYEVCHTLKTDERTSHIPIILLTAKADMESRISGLKRGADDYLTKPFNEQELLTRLENQMHIRHLLQMHFREAAPPPKGLEEEAKLENEFLKKLKSNLEDHLDEEDYGILQICRALGLSRTQLHRKVKALTGQSTSLYLRRIRLLKGKELLETTDLNISEVAYEVGFRHPSYFSRSFAEEFGVAPLDIKNK